MSKLMRSFRPDYVENALLVTFVMIIVLGLYSAAAYLLAVFSGGYGDGNLAGRSPPV